MSRESEQGPCCVSARGQAIRELMARFADELQGRATLRVTALADDQEELLELIPHNPRAAPVSVSHDPESDSSEVGLSVAGDMEEPDVDLQGIEQVIRMAIAGRVRVLAGAGRRRTECVMPDGTRSHRTTYTLMRGLLPAPGWQRRAQITCFEPYARDSEQVDPSEPPQ